MSDGVPIEYDADWLTWQIVFLTGTVAAVSHTAGRMFNDLVWSIGVSSVLATALIVAWLLKSVRPRVMEDV